MNETELIDRAVKRLPRDCRKNGWIYQQPSLADSEVIDALGHKWVRLFNVAGLLIEYRYTNGRLYL